VKFVAGTSAAEQSKAISFAGVLESEEISDLAADTKLITLKRDKDLVAVIDSIQKSTFVEYAEPNYLVSQQDVSNDPSVVDGNLWGMSDPTTSNGSTGGINATSAWANGYTGSNKTYVAVLDTGVDYTHPDLADNMWTNQEEIPGNGIDDDANGFVDDIHGWDFLSNTGDVMPGGNAHGTHVAGTIGAVGNNGIGVAGVSWDVSIISAKMISGNGRGTLAAAIAAVDYVTQLRTQKGLNIVATNNSWTFFGAYSQALRDAIRRGGDAGILFVAAAGNAGVNSDEDTTFPMGYTCTTASRQWDCLVSVSASDSNGNLASFSNYGKKSVDISAPGVSILSTLPGGGYGALSGTSMAAPHVTGAIALCAATNRSQPAFESVNDMFGTARKRDNLNGTSVTGALLDVNAYISKCAERRESFSGYTSMVILSSVYTNLARLQWADTITGEYGHEILIATGPAGCTGTFKHHAFIGPGLTSYPIRGLAEAEFFCLKIRGIRDAEKAMYVTSNMTITYTSNMPFVTGRALMADGVTPVAHLQVAWTAVGQSRTSANVRPVVTDLDGSYTLQVPNGTPGYIWIQTPARHETNATFLRPVPSLPLNFAPEGRLTVNEDTTVDLVMPPVKNVVVKVVDDVTGSPIANAGVSISSNSFYCPRGYQLFSTPTPVGESNCSYLALGHRAPLTDSNGNVTITTIAEPTRTSQVMFGTSHPGNLARVGQTMATVGVTDQIEVRVPPLISYSGSVYMADGVTPVSGLTVRWQAENIRSSYDPSIATASTDGSGRFTLMAPKGMVGMLHIQTPIYTGYSRHGQASQPSPMLPADMTPGGVVTITESGAPTLTMPPIVTQKVRVTDQATGLPVAGAHMSLNHDYMSCNSGYQIFPGASTRLGGDCYFKPIGIRGIPSYTDSKGELIVAFVSGVKPPSGSFQFGAKHPTNPNRIGEKSFRVGENEVVEIAISAQFRTLKGTVRLQDGVTPVKNLNLRWKPDIVSGEYSDAIIRTQTNADGSYSMQIPTDVPGDLRIETPIYHPTTPKTIYATYPSPELPLYFRAGGPVTMLDDRSIDITMPKLKRLKFEAVDAYTNEPVSEALISFSDRVGCNFQIFPGATNDCSFYVGGNPVPYMETDSQGNAYVTVIEDSWLRFTPDDAALAIHPLDGQRVGRLLIDPKAGDTYRIVIPGTPNIPKQPIAKSHNGEVQLSWTEPWHGGAFIDYYKVWVATDASGPYELVSQGSCAGKISSELRSCSVSGLTQGVTYYFAIIAHNEVGYSARSTATALRFVVPAAPGAPTNVVSTIANQSAKVSWLPPANDGDSPILDYKVSWSTGSKVCSTSPCTITGLVNGTAYSFQVLARNEIGDSLPSVASESVTPATTPDAPTNVIATIANQSATLTWATPANNGSAITGYRVSWLSGTQPCSASPCTITGLVNGTTYTFQVAARNALGHSDESALSPSVIPATISDAPSNVVSSIANQSAEVSWLPPSTDGGTPVLDYKVSWSNGSKVCSASPCTITGLVNGTAYSFQVLARNEIGHSSPSIASESVTPATSPVAPSAASVDQEINSIRASVGESVSNTPTPLSLMASTPGIPKVISAKSKAKGKATLKFKYTPVNGETIKKFEFRRSINGGKTWTTWAAVKSGSVTTGWKAGSTYRVQVRAVNSLGSGDIGTIIFRPTK
jgi:subtilisin family serine protease